MNLPDWREEPIGKKHGRASFDCGDAAMNEFLRRHARQSHDRGAAKTFLAISTLEPIRITVPVPLRKRDRHRYSDRLLEGKTILGFYTLCPASLEYARTPENVRKGLAPHDVPVFRLARLAVDRLVQGQGLGGQLILAAGRRCLLAATEVGGVALLIDAKNEWAARWYASYGAIPLADAPLSLVLPLTSIQRALEAAGKI